MPVRTPTLKNGAKLIRQYLAEKTINITHLQSLEALSRAYGYKDYQCAKADIDQKHGAEAQAPSADTQSQPSIILTDELSNYMIDGRTVLGLPEKVLEHLERIISSDSTADRWPLRAKGMLRGIFPVIDQSRPLTMSGLEHILTLDFFMLAYLAGYDHHAKHGRWPANLKNLRYYLEEDLPCFSVKKLILSHGSQPADRPTRQYAQNEIAAEQHGYLVQIARSAATDLCHQGSSDQQSSDKVRLASRWGGSILSEIANHRGRG